ncbi:MAG: transporter substrate-binding domain-containing protein [Bacteroidia bacterium]|nr:transporter substrate-binding domain-containing protein [Bacteroidia bacterium]
MIKKYLHPSLLLLYAFLAFWMVFAIWLAVQEANKVAGDFPKIKEEGVLRVCGEKDLFSFYHQKDSTFGFYYEMSKAFAERHHLQLIYIGVSNLSRRLKMLEENQCDVLSGPLPVVSDLRKQVDFTKSILESKLVLIQLKSNKNNSNNVVRNLVDFSGKQIYICENEAYRQRLNHLAAEISDTIYVRILMGYDSERMIAQVAAGLIDYAVCDKQVAKAYREKYPSIDVETPVGFNQMQAWGVKPGRKALLDSLNVFLTEYKKSPEFSRLIKKYISN